MIENIYICLTKRTLMKKLLVLIVVSIAGIFAASAQSSYEYKKFVSSEGQDLNYRLLTPVKVESKKEYPLVIFLHGAGERGSDNEKQLIHGSQIFLNPANQEKYPAYVLFPQCPEDGYWGYPNRPFGFDKMLPEGEMTPIFQAVKELILEYIAMPSVDASRVYIMGLSMGGMGTYDMVARFPDLFAAAVPICGSIAPGRIAAAKNVKFRIFHGDADTVVPVECSRRAYRELKAAGADVEYFEFAGCTHGSWNPAFNVPDFMEWIFAQKKSGRSRKK